MIRLLLKLALGLLALLTGLVGVVHALPHDVPALAELLAPLPGCALPCWIGIYPGKTQYQEAINLLQSSPYIAHVDTSQSVYISIQRFSWYVGWEWDNRTDAPISGSLLVEEGIVRQVVIDEEVPFGLLWTLFGAPDQGIVFDPLVYDNPPLDHTAIYSGSHVTILTRLSCTGFWWQPSTLSFGRVSSDRNAYDLATYRRYACWGLGTR